MELKFTSPGEHPPGTVFALLKRAWELLGNPELEEKIRQFDHDVREHPKTIGACTFITCLDSQVVGMASYDPRQGPEKGIIGWNCVVPEYQGRGIGKRQIQEILQIFHSRGFHKACVTTSDMDFYVPAQRMYEACGFIRRGTTEDRKIEYELEISKII